MPQTRGQLGETPKYALNQIEHQIYYSRASHKPSSTSSLARTEHLQEKQGFPQASLKHQRAARHVILPPPIPITSVLMHRPSPQELQEKKMNLPSNATNVLRMALRCPNQRPRRAQSRRIEHEILRLTIAGTSNLEDHGVSVR